MGGYLATQYIFKYPQNIDKLILLSPVGLPEKPEGYSPETMIRNAESWKRRSVIRFAAHVWRNNWSVFGPLRKIGRCGAKRLLKGYVRRRMEVIDEQEIGDVAELLH